ncbi:MAG: N-formylglutamate amidohydrolase [Hyphomicrobiales bacterium]
MNSVSSISVSSGQAPEWQAANIVEGNWDGQLLFLCDHARSAIPPQYENLGLPHSQLSRHIAYDIGMEALTRSLAKRLGAPAVLSTYSRLLLDPNRGEDDPTVLMRLSDGAVIPGNRYADDDERELRLRLFHRPYHVAISQAVDRMISGSKGPLIVSLHSFTPVWRGVQRPWHAGVLWDKDNRAADALITELEAQPDLIVGDNEPYSGALTNDTLNRHGTRRGISHVLLEVRQDLVADDAGVEDWSTRLAPIFKRIVNQPNITNILPEEAR